MCRSIKPLFHFDPPASDEEIQAAALQFVRKVSGYHTPSAINKPAFDLAIREVAQATKHLLERLETKANPHHRQRTEATKRH